MSEAVNPIKSIAQSPTVRSLERLLDSRPVAARAAVGAVCGFAIALSTISYVDAFRPEYSGEIRRLLEYQAGHGWQGALGLSAAYAAAAAGAGSVVGLLKYITRK
jgi:hypothetical protein